MAPALVGPSARRNSRNNGATSEVLRHSASTRARRFVRGGKLSWRRCVVWEPQTKDKRKPTKPPGRAPCEMFLRMSMKMNGMLSSLRAKSRRNRSGLRGDAADWQAAQTANPRSALNSERASSNTHPTARAHPPGTYTRAAPLRKTSAAAPIPRTPAALPAMPSPRRGANGSPARRPRTARS
jgi:hypothetical protein